LPEDKRRVLESKGWNLDDPKDAAFKLLDHYSLAEKRLGKPVDAFMDKPAKDQKFTDWAKANADILGLPKDLAGYKIEPPADFPKEIAWDGALAEKAAALALEIGAPPEVHQAYAGMFAQHMASIAGDLDAKHTAAKTELTQALTKDWGPQVEARTNRARQTIQHFAAEAGLTDDGISNALGALFGAGGGTGGPCRRAPRSNPSATGPSRPSASGVPGGNAATDCAGVRGAGRAVGARGAGAAGAEGGAGGMIAPPALGAGSA
jgi:hypothetical protein